MSELLISGEIELSAGIPRITPNDRRNSKQPLRRVTFSVESTTGRMAFDFRYKSPGRRTRETMVGRQVAAATRAQSTGRAAGFRACPAAPDSATRKRTK